MRPVGVFPISSSELGCGNFNFGLSQELKLALLEWELPFDYFILTAEVVWLTNLIDSCSLASFCIVFFTGFK